MNHATHRRSAVRIAAIALAVSCLGAAAIAQTNAPATNAPPASTGGAARQGGSAPAAPATPPAAAAPAAPAAPPAAAAPATPPAAAAAGGPVHACPLSAQEMAQATDCVCTAAAMQAEGQVWGVDIYTSDSNICRAALHAGVIPPGGGTVRVTPRGPQQSYAASTRNGVTTESYPAYEQSYSVAASEAKSDVDVSQCPANFEHYRAHGGVISCACTAALTAEGTVWGTDVYTDDSALCRAAVHAGIIPATGGAVRVRVVPGRQSYPGSTRNGVQSQDYGNWENAFAFDK